MAPAPISRKRFVSWLIVFTIGMLAWASPNRLIWSLGLGVCTFGNLILMTPQERSRPVTKGELWWIFGGLLMFAVILGGLIVSKRWLPRDFNTPALDIIRPIIGLVLWILGVWVVYRRNRISQAAGRKAPQAPGP
jgi:hypothetical protein